VATSASALAPRAWDYATPCMQEDVPSSPWPRFFSICRSLPFGTSFFRYEELLGWTRMHRRDQYNGVVYRERHRSREGGGDGVQASEHTDTVRRVELTPELSRSSHNTAALVLLFSLWASSSGNCEATKRVELAASTAMSAAGPTSLPCHDCRFRSTSGSSFTQVALQSSPPPGGGRVVARDGEFWVLHHITSHHITSVHPGGRRRAQVQCTVGEGWSRRCAEQEVCD
jgi:hypothetical protein